MSQDTLPVEDLEDGELEDGEYDDDTQAVTNAPTEKSPPPPKIAEPQEVPNLKQGAGSMTMGEVNKRPHDMAHSGSSSGSESEEETKSRRKKRRKQKRRKEERGKRKKGKKYTDHDRHNEGQGWKGFSSPNTQRKSPPGPYDSPQGSPDFYEELQRHRSLQEGPKQGYDSPPGLYDSPSDEDYDGPKRKQPRHEKKTSLLSMVGDNYMDANVAANEKEDVYHHGRMKGQGGKPKKNDKRGRPYKDRGHDPRDNRGNDRGKKRSLLDTPKNKPYCKFYMDGKCSKGMDCPFSHDMKPNRKMEVCKFYITDECLKGASCLYLHSEYPCKFYHTGAQCYQGDNCKFSHADLTDETAPLVDKFPPFMLPNMPRNQGGGGQREAPPHQKHGNQNDHYGEQEQHYNRNNSDRMQQHGEMEERGEHRRSPKKKSLLGTPPREEEQAPNGNKIPSLFDIQTFPPTQSESTGQDDDEQQPQQQHQTQQVPDHPRQGQGPPPGPRGPPPGPPRMRPPFFNGPGMPPPGVPPPGMMGMPPRGMPPPPHMGGPMPPRGPPIMPVPQDQAAAALLNMIFGAKQQGPDSIMSPGIDPSMPDMGMFQGEDGNPLGHLPKVQQDLFARIQNRQREGGQHGGPMGPDEAPMDDNWYSSDEEGGGNKGLIQTLQKSGPMDVGGMISALRQQMSGDNPPTPAALQQMLGQFRDPRMNSGRADPRLNPAPQASPRDDPRLIDRRPPAAFHTPLIDSVGTEDTFRYRVVIIDVDNGKTIPSHIDKNSARFKDDPRIQKALRSQEPRMVRQTSVPPIPAKPAAMDPRMVKSVSEIIVPKPGIPLQTSNSAGPNVDAFAMLSQLITPATQPNTSAPIIVPPLPTVSLPSLLNSKPPPAVNVPAPSKPLDPRLARQQSASKAESGGESEGDISPAPIHRDPLSHRTDPRFRRKSKSGPSVTPPSSSPSQDDFESEDFTMTQRKSRVEYTSPLSGAGDSAGDSTKQDSYNSYNRKPNVISKSGAGGDQSSPCQFQKKASLAGEDAALSAMPLLPEQMQMPPLSQISALAPTDTVLLAQGLETSVKDVFKTLDPTASPFC